MYRGWLVFSCVFFGWVGGNWGGLLWTETGGFCRDSRMIQDASCCLSRNGNLDPGSCNDHMISVLFPDHTISTDADVLHLFEVIFF